MIFLTVEKVITFHTQIIQKHGGAPGIRELTLLISALEMPKASMFGDFLHISIYEKAAAYLYHIVSNHPFIDGNKRVGLVSALTFLKVNGISLKYDASEIEEFVVQVAAGNIEKQSIAVFFQAHHPEAKKHLKQKPKSST